MLLPILTLRQMRKWGQRGRVGPYTTQVNTEFLAEPSATASNIKLHKCLMKNSWHTFQFLSAKVVSTVVNISTTFSKEIPNDLS